MLRPYALLGLLVSLLFSATASAQSCDRDCLKRHLDTYLKPFMRRPIAYEQLATAIVQAPGLDGSVQDAALDEVLGNTDEPAVKAQYEAMLTKRKSL